MLSCMLPIACAEGDRASGEFKSTCEYFPHRTDLLSGEMLARAPKHEFPRAKLQPVAPMPKTVPYGRYRLTLVIVIEKSGDVGEAVVAQTSGVAEIDNAQLAGVRNWKFRPAKVKGKPVAVALKAPFHVNIADD